MSEFLPGPSPIPPRPDGSTTVIDSGELPIIPPAAETAVSERPPPRRGPLDDVQIEKPRTHPVAYAALALATLALLLSLFGGGDGDGGYRQVKVGNADCVIGPQADAADALYCRTPPVPQP